MFFHSNLTKLTLYKSPDNDEVNSLISWNNNIKIPNEYNYNGSSIKEFEINVTNIDSLPAAS